MFSEGIEREQSLEMSFEMSNLLPTTGLFL